MYIHIKYIGLSICKCFWKSTLLKYRSFAAFTMFSSRLSWRFSTVETNKAVSQQPCWIMNERIRRYYINSAVITLYCVFLSFSYLILYNDFSTFNISLDSGKFIVDERRRVILKILQITSVRAGERSFIFNSYDLLSSVTHLIQLTL